MPKSVKSIRWTTSLASTEFNQGRESITKGLKANGIKPGDDGRYSTAQIADAIFGSAKLEREAREAKYRAQIDDAEMIRNEREIQEGRLVYVNHVRDIIADGLTKAVQIIRMSRLSDKEKREV